MNKMTLEVCAACQVRSRTVCDVLDNCELSRMNAIRTEVTLDAQRTVFYQEDPANYLYNVTAGNVRVSKMLADGRRQVTGFLFPGDFLGLSLNRRYAYTAEAISAVTLCRFPREKLESLFADITVLSQRMLTIASNELVSAQDQMLLLGRKSAMEKVASFLLSLSDRAVARNEPADPVQLPMARTDIADYLGLTVETVSRTLSQLVKSGVLTLSTATEVVVLDRDRLMDIAEANLPDTDYL